MRGGAARRLLAWLAVLGLFLVAGAVAGLVWATAWEPPQGVAYQGRYLPLSDGSSQFAVEGHYLVVCAAAGLAAGLLAAVLGRRDPLGVLLVAVAASVMAGLLAAWIGRVLGPQDPHVAARSADDLAAVPADLSLSSPVLLLALPAGALVSLTVVLLVLELRGPARVSDSNLGTVRA